MDMEVLAVAEIKFRNSPRYGYNSERPLGTRILRTSQHFRGRGSIQHSVPVEFWRQESQVIPSLRKSRTS